MVHNHSPQRHRGTEKTKAEDHQSIYGFFLFWLCVSVSLWFIRLFGDAGTAMRRRQHRAMRMTLQAVALFLLVTLTFAPTVMPYGQQGSGAIQRHYNAERVTTSPYPRRPSPEALKWADAELRRMSVDEKVGQLIAIGINATFLNQDSDAFRALRRQVEENHVGSIILFRGPVYESVHLVNRMQQLARRPLLISADFEAGTGMRLDDTVDFPWNMAVGATGNPEYARRQGEITAREARVLGIQQIFAPVVDVNNNAANPVINVRSYGEDPAEVTRFATAFIEGAQQAGVIATAKHFPGHGDTAVDSHRGLPVINVDRARLEKVELIPFAQQLMRELAQSCRRTSDCPRLIRHLSARSRATRLSDRFMLMKVVRLSLRKQCFPGRFHRQCLSGYCGAISDLMES